MVGEQRVDKRCGLAEYWEPWQRKSGERAECKVTMRCQTVGSS